MAVELYKGLVPIIRRDLNEGFIRGTPDDMPSTGAVPRDYTIDPVEMRDSPDQIKLYSPSDYDALYDAGEDAEDSLEHLFLRGDKPAFELLDQNGFPDCWCHSTAHAIMFDALKQNLPIPRINAVAMATMMKQLNGGWCGLSMKFVRDNGAPIVGNGIGQWPYQSRKGNDTPQLRANMKRHQSLEDWYDVSREVYDQKLTKSQLATCLFDNLPSPSDYNRFGHSMLSVRYVRIEAGSYGILTLNSWKGFGYHGLCVLAEMVPDSACSLRAGTPSDS